MAISKVEDPMNEGEFLHFITGTVKRILIKEAKNPKFASHDGSLIIQDEGNDDVFVNIGVNVKEGYEPRIQYAEGKKGSETWFTLNQGDKVKLQVLPNEYNGKTYYKTTTSRIKVTKKAEAGESKSSPAKSSGKSDYEPYDLVGVMTGHAVGAAARLSALGAKGSLVDLAEIVHTKTTELKTIVAEKTGLSPNSKNVGNSVGNAINAAVELYKGENLDEFLVNKGQEIYFQVSQVVYETIQNKGSDIKSKTTETKEKTPAKTQKVVKQERPAPTVDFDEDIPF